MSARFSYRKGWAWRRSVETWLEAAGFNCTVRGIGVAGDDIYAQAGELRLSIEAKNHQEIQLASFVDQAVRQAAMYPSQRGVLPVVVIHRRGRPLPEDGYVVLPGWAFIDLIRTDGG